MLLYLQMPKASSQTMDYDATRVYTSLLPENFASVVHGRLILTNDLAKNLYITRLTSFYPSLGNSVTSADAHRRWDMQQPSLSLKLHPTSFISVNHMGEIKLGVASIFQSGNHSFQPNIFFSNFQGNYTKNGTGQLILPRYNTLFISPAYSYNKVYNKIYEQKLDFNLQPFIFNDRSYIGTAREGENTVAPLFRDLYTYQVNRMQKGILANAEYTFIRGKKISSTFIVKDYHEKGIWGVKNYIGNQKNTFAEIKGVNGVFYRNMELGFQYYSGKINEDLNGISYTRNERVGGVYGIFSNAMAKYRNKVRYYIRLRQDYHNLIGWQSSGQLNLDFGTDNMGYGLYGNWGNRIANPISQGRSFLLGNRIIKSIPDVFAEKFSTMGIHGTATWRRFTFYGVGEYIHYPHRLVADIKPNQEVYFYHGSGADIYMYGQVIYQSRYRSPLQLKLTAQYRKVTWRNETERYTPWYVPTFLTFVSGSYSFKNPFRKYYGPQWNVEINNAMVYGVHGYTRQGAEGNMNASLITDISLTTVLMKGKYNRPSNWKLNIGISNIFNNRLGATAINMPSQNNYTGQQFQAPLVGRRLMIGFNYSYTQKKRRG
jgi:hypothetical protein